MWLLGLGALAWIGVGWVGDTGQERFTLRALVTVVTLLLILLWLALFSGLGWKRRLTVLALILASLFGLTRLVQIEEVTGDLVPILSWRWSGGGLGGDVSRTAESIPAAWLEPGPFDFPQFLGPSRNAMLEMPEGIQLLRDWSTSPPQELWRAPIGAGWSAYAVQGEVAVTQEQRDGQEWVVAYRWRTGERLWAHTDEGDYQSTIAGDGPRATPTIADGRVYTLGVYGRLNALELAGGRRLWTRDIVREHGGGQPEWGRSGSPLVVDGLVVVSAGGLGGHSLVAYQAATGEPTWSGGSDGSGYSSPFLAQLAGTRQIVIFNKGSVSGHDAATGAMLWNVPWSAEQPNVAQPLVLPGDRLLVSSGYGVGSKTLHVNHDSDGEWRVDVLWESPRLKAKFTNPVLHEGYVYGLDDGTLVCLDPETGERCWKRGRYGHGQMLLVDDLLLVQTEKGEIVLIEPNSEELSELGRFQALTGKSWNTPTLIGEHLLVRNHRESACFKLPLAKL